MLRGHGGRRAQQRRNGSRFQSGEGIGPKGGLKDGPEAIGFEILESTGCNELVLLLDRSELVPLPFRTSELTETEGRDFSEKGGEIRRDRGGGDLEARECGRIRKAPSGEQAAKLQDRVYFLLFFSQLQYIIG